MKQTVIVGMSGGVDSTVAAYLLQQQGYDVQGVFMKNWEDPTEWSGETAVYRKNRINDCPWEIDLADARAAAEKLGIPFRVMSFVNEYYDLVFSEFVSELKAGRTPNPDILCNQEIKFRLFFERALAEEGVDFVATGHYAKINVAADGSFQLLKPADREKDQTYFLHRMNAGVLPRVLFPLQDLTKGEVRKIALEQGFLNAEKKDSTGICFIGDIDYKTFIDQYIEKKPGKIVLVAASGEREVIGEHQGLHFFTIGQRRGIDIGGTGPFYVFAKDMASGELLVTNNVDDPRLFARECRVEKMHWLVSAEDARVQVGSTFECEVMIRYRQTPQPATVTVEEEGRIAIAFQSPERAVTPGQSAVLYDGDVVLGGGIIA